MSKQEIEALRKEWRRLDEALHGPLDPEEYDASKARKDEIWAIVGPYVMGDKEAS